LKGRRRPTHQQERPQITPAAVRGPELRVREGEQSLLLRTQSPSPRARISEARGQSEREGGREGESKGGKEGPTVRERERDQSTKGEREREREPRAQRKKGRERESLRKRKREREGEAERGEGRRE